VVVFMGLAVRTGIIKDKKYQFCVRLQNGQNNDLNHYVWASENQLKNAIEGIKSKINPLDAVGESKFYRCLYGEGIGSLKINAMNEEDANDLARELGLPQPFVKRKVQGKEQYVLNRD